MEPSELQIDEVEARLEELHADSFGWACSCCGWNEADAEDVLQKAYVKVLSGAARYDGRARFRTWLFGVIRLTAMEHRRRERTQAERAERSAADPALQPPAPERPDAPLERAERARRLRGALEQLPPRQQEVLNLVFYHDLTLKEAAAVMEVSIGSARVHYDRGKKRLRALLAEASEPGGAR